MRQRSQPRLVLLALPLLLGLLAAAGLGRADTARTACTRTPASQTLTTSYPQDSHASFWTVPADVQSVCVEVVGSPGSDSVAAYQGNLLGGAGGSGADVVAQLSVTSGQIFALGAGQAVGDLVYDDASSDQWGSSLRTPYSFQGGNGANGGRPGGYASVVALWAPNQFSTPDQESYYSQGHVDKVVVVAGGGGGAGGSGATSGAGGLPGPGATGGNGGTPDGQTGAAAGGGGATGSAAGAGGVGFGNGGNGSDGDLDETWDTWQNRSDQWLGRGGAGATGVQYNGSLCDSARFGGWSGGGGGGGGWHGGGGGGRGSYDASGSCLASQPGGGGGGGASYVDPGFLQSGTSVSYGVADHTAAPSITIVWTPASTTTSSTTTTTSTTTSAPASSIAVTRFDDPSGAGSCPSDCSLRQAVAAVASGGTVTLPDGDYTLSQGELAIAKDVTVAGAGSGTTSVRQTVQQRVVHVASGTVDLLGLRVSGGNTRGGGSEPNAGVGGGIWVDGPATVTLSDVTVSGNHADSSGGGIDNDGRLEIDRATISGNSAGGGALEIGGGINDFGPSLAIANSVIAGNSAVKGGGVFSGSDISFVNVTVVDNTGSTEGGGLDSGGGTFTLLNTLLDGNSGGNCAAAVASQGHNLSSDRTCGLTAMGDREGVDAQLDAAWMPAAASPAVDAGSDVGCPSPDRAGTARPQGAHCDIGSFERAAAAPPTTSSTTTTTTTTSSTTTTTPPPTTTTPPPTTTTTPASTTTTTPAPAPTTTTPTPAPTTPASTATTTTTTTPPATTPSVPQPAPTPEPAPTAASTPTPQQAPAKPAVPALTKPVLLQRLNLPPRAVFVSAARSLLVRFDARGSGDVDGHIVSYRWSFGDRRSASGVRATHRFPRTGRYLVALTVTDDDGAAETVQARIVVRGDVSLTVSEVVSVADPAVLAPAASIVVPESVTTGEETVLTPAAPIVVTEQIGVGDGPATTSKQKPKPKPTKRR